jgi:hypothetical protein
MSTVSSVFQKVLTSLDSSKPLDPTAITNYYLAVKGELIPKDVTDTFQAALLLNEIHTRLLNEIMTEQAFTKRVGFYPAISLKDSLEAYAQRPCSKDYSPSHMISYLLLKQDKPSDYKDIYDVFPASYLVPHWATFEALYIGLVNQFSATRKRLGRSSQQARRYKAYQLQKLANLKLTLGL